MSYKEYKIIDGLPEELKENRALKAWLDFFAKHQIEAGFRVLEANEPLSAYIDDEYPSDADARSRLNYPEIYVHLKCNNKHCITQSDNICLNRLSHEMRALRSDECIIDGFYQANHSIDDMIRIAREFVIPRNSYPTADIDRNSVLDIDNFLFGNNLKWE